MKEKKLTPLLDFLKQECEATELRSLRETPDSDYSVRPSAFNKLQRKVQLLANLLSDLYDVEEVPGETEKEDAIYLRPKSL